MTNVLSSGVIACINVARTQNAPTATSSRCSTPSVMRNGSDMSCAQNAVRSLPKRRARAGANSAVAPVNTCAIEKNEPIWPLEQLKRWAK